VSIEFKKVKSASVEAVGYDAATRTLALRFKSGGATYHYTDVDPEKHAQLLRATSIGGFVHKHIVKQHPHSKVDA
jgi:hypothetical protein